MTNLYSRIGNRKMEKTMGSPKPPEYNVWFLMICRCHEPTRPQYAYYGARGISVCDRWRYSFENFLADMGSRPTSLHKLDRIDNDGNYEPQNCRWTTQKQQMRNNRRNRLLTFQGKTLCMVEWAELLGVTPELLNGRINTRGWSVEDALTCPPLARGYRLHPTPIRKLRAPKTHCMAGHLYDEANTAIRTNGRRRCRACARIDAEKRRNAKRGGERQPTLKDTLGFALQEGPATVQELSARFNRSPGQVKNALANLQRSGLARYAGYFGQRAGKWESTAKREEAKVR